MSHLRLVLELLPSRLLPVGLLGDGRIAPHPASVGLPPEPSGAPDRPAPPRRNRGRGGRRPPARAGPQRRHRRRAQSPAQRRRHGMGDGDRARHELARQRS